MTLWIDCLTGTSLSRTYGNHLTNSWKLKEDLNMDSDVYLAAYHGGLGDSLQFSTLPEEFYKQQGRKTYVWGGATFRNQEIYDLVWED